MLAWLPLIRRKENAHLGLQKLPFEFQICWQLWAQWWLTIPFRFIRTASILLIQQDQWKNSKTIHGASVGSRRHRFEVEGRVHGSGSSNLVCWGQLADSINNQHQYHSHQPQQHQLQQQLQHQQFQHQQQQVFQHPLAAPALMTACQWHYQYRYISIAVELIAAGTEVLTFILLFLFAVPWFVVFDCCVQDVEEAIELLDNETDKERLRDAFDDYNNSFILKWDSSGQSSVCVYFLLYFFCNEVWSF